MAVLLTGPAARRALNREQPRHFQAAPPLIPARRPGSRQALGILHAVYLGEPGVLAALQRITLRIRAGQRR